MAFFQGETLWVNQLADGLAALVLDVPDRKVNVLGDKVFADLEEALERVAAGTFRALLVRSGKPDSFCAGADLHELAGRAPEQIAAVAERGQRLFTRLADLAIPTVAVIAGPALGGGLELALACDYRFVVDRPRTQLGLPEVELGLLPAWGGTQRLPRVVGLERGLHMILGARRLAARDAFNWSLADHLIDNPDDIPPELLANLMKQPPRRRRGWRSWLLEATRLGRWLLFRGARRILERRVPDDMPAPWEALEAVRVGLRKGTLAGFAHEREAIARLAMTPACRNLIRLFLQREEARKAPERKRDDARTIRRVGIIGAGTLGLPIAVLALVRGFEIVIKEANEMALGYSMLRLLGQLEQAVSRGQLTPQEYTKRLAPPALRGTAAWKYFDELDLVIDARDDASAAPPVICEEIEQRTAATAILASAAGTVSIAKLQAGLEHPERVAGLHLFQPVARVPLVEIVSGPGTAGGVVEDLRDWVRKLGRTGLVVKDGPGFLVHRILFPGLNEAILLLVEEITADRIDEAMERFGMPQGPLEYLDQMGLDEAAALAKMLQPTYGARIPLSPVLEMMVEQNWRGLKTNAGFYRYRRGRKKKHAALGRMLADLAPAPREFLARDEQIALVQERVAGLIVNEAAIVLQEALADAETIDLAMVLAGAWAPHRGGPLRFARDRSPSEMVNSLLQLAGNYGQRFEPCALLRRWADGTAPAPFPESKGSFN